MQRGTPRKRCLPLLPEAHSQATRFMTPTFLRQLIIYTVCNVTGEEPKNIVAQDEVKLNTRNWEQIFSRLEATLDIYTGMLTLPRSRPSSHRSQRVGPPADSNWSEALTGRRWTPGALKRLIEAMGTITIRTQIA